MKRPNRFKITYRLTRGLYTTREDGSRGEYEIDAVTLGNDGELWSAGGPPWGVVWMCEGSDVAAVLLEELIRNRLQPKDKIARLRDAVMFKFSFLDANVLGLPECRVLRFVFRRALLSPELDLLRARETARLWRDGIKCFLLDGSTLLDINGNVVSLAAPRRTLPPRLRFRVLQRDRFTCVYCGRSAPEVVLHVDHVVPRSRGGEDDERNMVTSCQDCNLGKGAMQMPYP